MKFQVEFENFPSPAGPLRFGLLPWDTETFGFPVHEIQIPDDALAALDQHLAQLCDRLGRSRPALLVCKVPLVAVARPGRALSRNGFYAVETLIEVHMALAQVKLFAPRLAQDLRLRHARPEDLPALVRMAQHAFRKDRFHADPNLSQANADRRFEAWVRRGMQAQDPVFIVEEQGSSGVLGFFHIREATGAQKTVDLSLAAVDPSYHKTGLGVLMYQMVLLECGTKGFKFAESRVSVANGDVLNLFTRLGFSLRNPVVTFHCYLDDAKPKHG
jgi:L-amino acid N-acyltransferase YncA